MKNKLFEEFGEKVPGSFLVYKNTKDEEIVYANQNLIELLGCSTYEEFYEYLSGKFSNMILNDDVEKVNNQIKFQTSNDNEYDHVFYHILTKNGTIHYVEDFGKLVRIDGEEYFYVFIVDTAMKTFSKDIDQQTGLPGQKRFLDFASKIVLNYPEDKFELALVYFDLVHFRDYNIKYGIDAGNAFVKEFTKILQNEFTNNPLARIYDDNFVVLTQNVTLIDKLDNVNRIISNRFKNFEIRFKVGIYILKDRNDSLRFGLENAKMACESINFDKEKFYKIFDNDMKRRREIYSYVISHINEAIEKGWIKVFYQPIIRTLSNKLYGFEALSRWDDPVYGLLTPYYFIPALEDNSLTYKLDEYVIQKICEEMAENKKRGNHLLPVSFNLSRDDFFSTDPYKILDNNIKKYNLQKDLFKIEITESMIMRNPEKIQYEIEKFHKGGYEILMDDFGAAYSSLNILSNFNFDEIKIDMEFMRNFNEKSRKIVSTTVQMCKKLNIHSLCEGVETKEQLEFLKKIGCELVQGFYFSDALPYNQVIEHLYNMGIVPENSEEKAVYDGIGYIDFESNPSFGILYFDGDHTFKPIFLNDKFSKAFSRDSFSLQDSIYFAMNEEGSANNKKFLNLVKRAIESNSQEDMSDIINGRYYLLSMHVLSKLGDGYVIFTSINDVSYDYSKRVTEKFDLVTKNLLSLFISISIVDFAEHSREIVMSHVPNEKIGTKYYNIGRIEDIYDIHNIEYKDQARFIKFISIENIQANLLNTTNEYISDLFFIKTLINEFELCEIIITKVPTGKNQIMICAKTINSSSLKEVARFIDHNIKQNDEQVLIDNKTISYSLLWETLMNYSTEMIFIKDAEQRYVYANYQFLKFHGIDHLETIIGKKSSDFQWLLNSSKYANEEKVLMDGNPINDTVFKIIINGQAKMTVRNSYPIYSKGKIVGSIGVVRDLTDNINNQNKGVSENIIEPETGLYNSLGLILIANDFINNAKLNNDSFSLTFIDVYEYPKFFKSFGTSFCINLSNRIKEIIYEVYSKNAIVGRVQDGLLAIYIKENNLEKLKHMAKEVEKKIYKINSLDGKPVTIYVNYAFDVYRKEYTVRSFTQHVESLLSKNNGEGENIIKEGTSINQLSISKETVDSYHHGTVAVIDPSNYNVLYFNINGLKALNLPYDYDWSKKKCYELLDGRTLPCPTCPIKILNDEPYYIFSKVNETNKERYLISYLNITFKGKPALLTKSYMLNYLNEKDKVIRTEDYKDQDFNYGSVITNVASPIPNILKRLCTYIGADRLFIYNRKNAKTLICAYEYCKEGLHSQMDVLGKINAVDYIETAKRLNQNDFVYYPDFRAIAKANPDLYNFLTNQLQLKSAIGINIAVDNVKSHFLIIQNPKPEAFTKEYYHVLSLYVEYIAVALYNEKLLTLSSKDSLTGVMNRHAFDSYMSGTKDEGYIIVSGDLNNLKLINDTKGHNEGDEYIREAANTLSEIFGGPNHVFRFGGDEFICVKQAANPKTLDDILSRLRRLLRRNHVSMAIGGVWDKNPNSHLTEVIDEADRRMYLNKEDMHKNNI